MSYYVALPNNGEVMMPDEIIDAYRQGYSWCVLRSGQTHGPNEVIAMAKDRDDAMRCADKMYEYPVKCIDTTVHVIDRISSQYPR